MISPDHETSINELRVRIEGTLNTLTLDELMAFSAYIHDVETDFNERQRQWRDRPLDSTTSRPAYIKLSGKEDTSWWPKVESLLQDGDGTEIDPVILGVILSFITRKARENPHY